MRQSDLRPKRSWALYGLVAAFLALLLSFMVILSRVDEVAGRRQAELLESALRSAAVSAYATEGVYPPKLSSIRDRYGVVVDDRRFVVVYDIFADNMMPSISVLYKGEDAT